MALAVERVMVTLEDFTTLSRGSDVPLEGRVDRCPQCGRNGIEHAEPERLLFVHVQETDLLSDGMRTEPRDCCRVTKVAVA
jgi:hypothetical protein